MYVTLISPISDSMPLQFQKLSFYGREDLATGSIVPIVFNNRPMHGIVLESAPLQNLKQSIKSSPFTMKKLDLTPDTIIVPNTCTLFIMNVADITLQNPGKLYWHFFASGEPLSFSREIPLSELVVAPLPEGGSAIAVGGGSNKSQNPTLSPSSSQGREITNHAYEYTHEKTITELQNNPPNIIICPTSAFCQLIEKQLEQNPSKEKDVAQKTHIITPTQLPSLLLKHGHRYEHLTITVIHASDIRYMSYEKSPYMDYREIIVPALRHLYPGETTLSLYDPYIDIQVQNIFNLDEASITRSIDTPNIIVSEHTRDTRYSDTMFSHESFTHILQAVSRGKTVQIITARKGVSGSVSCSNCAFIAKCTTCNHVQSIVQSNTTKTRHFYCHTCRTKSLVYDMCPQCEGMLAPLGYTTQTIHASLQSLSILEHVPMIIIDSDTTKTYKKLQKQLSDFNNGIIITTPAMTDYLPQADVYVVVSLEGLLAQPAYDTDRIVYRLLRTLGNAHLIVQTKNETIDELWNKPTVSYADYESNLSQEYHTPPHTTLLTLSKQILSTDMLHEIQSIKEFFTHHHDVHYTHTTRGRQKARTVMIHHHISYSVAKHQHVIQNILRELAGYSIIKNARLR